MGVTRLKSPRVFLSAQWRDLVMLNYEVDPQILTDDIPLGTELDDFQGRHYISIVGFKFLNTKIMGMSIPGHRHFVEINLRFYVKRIIENEIRRGVVFIKEIVPKPMITAVARWLYNENYETHPVHSYFNIHDCDMPQIRYLWGDGANQYRLEAHPTEHGNYPEAGSEEEFITEHYWGYSRQKDGGTMEYRVEHPQWKVANVTRAGFYGDLVRLYGEKFQPYLTRQPSSIFVANGSDIQVRSGMMMPREL